MNVADFSWSAYRARRLPSPWCLLLLPRAQPGGRRLPHRASCWFCSSSLAHHSSSTMPLWQKRILIQWNWNKTLRDATMLSRYRWVRYQGTSLLTLISERNCALKYTQFLYPCFLVIDGEMCFRWCSVTFLSEFSVHYLITSLHLFH